MIAPQTPHDLVKPSYRPDIDGLRAIAVVSVVLFHAFPEWSNGGFIGVDVFFVISGYLISSIIFQNLHRGSFTLFGFYARRIKRIFPALVLVLAASFFAGWLSLLADDYVQLSKHVAAGAGFAANFVFWSEAGYFDQSALAKPLWHLWSLAIEEQFYLVWPLLAWIAWRWRWTVLPMMMLAAAGSLYLNVEGIGKDQIATFYSPQTRAWELLCGALLAWPGSGRSVGAPSKTRRSGRWAALAARLHPGAHRVLLLNALSFVGLAFLAAALWLFHVDLAFPGWWAVVPVLGTMLVIVAGAKAWPNRMLLSSRVAVWLGLISYPLYLWHWPLLSYAGIVETEFPGWFMRAAMVVAAVLLAWLTFKFVERPIRFGPTGRATVWMLILSMVALASAGFSNYYESLFRFAHEEKWGEIPPSYTRSNLLAGEPCVGFSGVGDAECRSYGNGAKLVAVWGDSHALLMQKAVPISAVPPGVRLMIIGHTGCPPIEGVFRADGVGNASNCPSKKVLSGYANYIRSERPAVLILTGRWTIYLRGWTRDGIRQSGTHFLSANENEAASAVNSKLAFERQMRKTIEDFAGTEIYVVGQVPDLHHIDERVIKKIKSIKRLIIDRWHSVEMDAFGALTALPFKYINTRDYFCGIVSCSLRIESEYLYADDNHLSVPGMLRLWEILRENMCQGTVRPYSCEKRAE